MLGLYGCVSNLRGVAVAELGSGLRKLASDDWPLIHLRRRLGSQVLTGIPSPTRR
jgi:hypothetical protein